MVFFFFFFFGYAMGHVELPWPGIELMFPEMEAGSLNHWNTREVPCLTMMDKVFILSLPQFFYL